MSSNGVEKASKSYDMITEKLLMAPSFIPLNFKRTSEFENGTFGVSIREY